MSVEQSAPHPTIDRLVGESRAILADPEQVYDLAGKRFALRTVELTPYFRKKTFRLGVIGEPNRGKTTPAYSGYLALHSYGLPAGYVDLDIYSNSGPATSGEIEWTKRPKRASASQREVALSIKKFRKTKPGFVIGDFPGKLDNPYQRDRLAACDLALVLGNDPDERKGWMELAHASHTPLLWLRTQLGPERHLPIDPTVYDLDRIAKPFSLDILTAMTRILEVAAAQRNRTISDPWRFFSEAERVILEEVLDFEFAPFDITTGRT